MITNFFIPELNNHDVQELWFEQDGAICHTARATIDLLKDTFGDRLISRLGPVNWPPRSCDLTPLDYFLWVYVKSLVYADKPQTLNHLEDNIRRVIADIRPQMLEKVIENWPSRLDYIRAGRGSPMPEIIFKILLAEIVEVKIEVVSPSIVPSGNFAELNRTVTCMVLKANDRRTSCPCHDEFHGPLSGYVRQRRISSEGHVFVASVSSVRSLVLLKIHCVEKLMHVKSVKDQSPFVGVEVWRVVPDSGVVLVT
ncbi:putative LOC100569746 [Trichonephila clavipes]|nr:putative LOC100569746 [Trichonephila clavipes]